jgi:hypothetical protein
LPGSDSGLENIGGDGANQRWGTIYATNGDFSGDLTADTGNFDQITIGDVTIGGDGTTGGDTNTFLRGDGTWAQILKTNGNAWISLSNTNLIKGV